MQGHNFLIQAWQIFMILNTMPGVLVKAQQALDKAVDFCYR